MICKKCKQDKDITLFKKKELISSKGRRFSNYKTCKKCSTGIEDRELIKTIRGEKWVRISGYEHLYEISNIGRVKSLGNNRFKIDKMVKLAKDKNGYSYVCLWKKGLGKKIKIHRLVATAFIPNPDNKPMVNHKNGIKTDNRVKNLEWCSCKENVAHAILSGLSKRHGSDNPSAKLTKSNVRYIRKNFNHNPGKFSKMFSVTDVTIYNIIRKKTWNKL